MNDLKKEFVDMIAEGMEDRNKPKVWIMLINSSTMREILGVYSTKEKALEAYQKAFGVLSGTYPANSIGIMERELE